MNFKSHPGKIICFLRFAVLGAAMGMFGNSAHAAFHLWRIRELYTNLDGSQQFIELIDTSGSQQFLSGQKIMVTDQAGTITHTLTLPSDLPGDTLNHTFLIGTPGFTSAAGAVKPDFTMPSGFLFATGGTISFFGSNSGTYGILPTDGVLSRVYPGSSNQSNTPQNFAGAAGHLVPEPTTWALFGMGGIGFLFLLRRRAA